MANKQIRYEIKFDLNNRGLQEAKSFLTEIQRMTLNEFKIKVNADAKASTEQLRTQLNSIKEEARRVETALSESFNPKLNSINVDSFLNKLKASGTDINQVAASFAKLGASGNNAFNSLTRSLLTTKREVKETHKVLDSLAETFGNTIKWTIASGAINAVTGAIRNAWNYSIKLDASLNNIRIVTEKSASSMEKFAKKANDAARSLGASTTAYTDAALIYYQQGLNDTDVQARTDVTVKAANVTGQSAAEVSEQLTAVWNGYKVVAEEAEIYVDKLSAVAASTAADLEELSEGMSKVASGANAMGVDIDQLTAQLSTIVSVTRQDASSVGTALKTIFARMGDLKVDGVDEFGVSLGDVSGTLKQVGIEVLDTNGNLRAMGTVIEEVAGKWGTWTEAQQQAIAIAMAGKRQYNNLLALFENWEMYESALSTSKDSEGTLQKQQDIYMESTKAHLEQLATSGEKVFDAFFNNESMNVLLDVLTSAVDAAGNFINLIGGGGNLLLMFGGIAGQVLGKVVGNLVNNIAQNSLRAKENERQYRAELELTSQLGEKYANSDEKNQQKLIELKKKHLELEKYISEEQRAQNEAHIEAVANAMADTDNAKSDANKLNERFREMQGQKDTENKVRSTISFAATSYLEGGSDIELQMQEDVEAAEKRVATAKENTAAKKNTLTGLEAERAELKKLESEQLESVAIDHSEKNQKALLETKEKIKKIDEQIAAANNDLRETEIEEKNIIDEQNKLLEKQSKIKANSVSMDDAIAQTKGVAEYSHRLEDTTKSVLSNETFEKQQAAYIEKYGEIKPDQYEAEIAKLEGQKGNQEQTGRTDKEINKQITALKNLQKVEAEAQKGEKQRKNTAKELKGMIDEVTNSEDKNTKLTQKSINAIINVKKEYSDLSTLLGKVANGENLTEEEAKRLEEALKKVKAAASESGDAADKLTQDLNENAEAAKRAKDAQQAAEEQAAKDAKAQATQARTQGFVELAGAAAQAYSMIASLYNSLTTIWSNEEDSFADKMLATLTTLLPMLLMTIPTILSVGASIKKLGTSAQIAGNTAAQGGAAASVAWSTFLIVILAIVAAIVVAIAVFAIISSVASAAADDGKKAFEEMSKAAQTAKEELNATKKAAEDLKAAFENYDKAQKAIDEMTAGTEEWRNAIQDANLQVLDLIDKYPELANYVNNVDGRLLISDEGREVLTEQLEKAEKQARRTSLVMGAQKLNAKNDMIAQQGSTSILKSTGVSESTRDAFYKNAIDVVNEKGNSILNGTEEEFIKALGATTDSEKKMAKALYENKVELAKSAAAVAANTTAINLQKQQAAASYLEENYAGYETSGNKDALSKVVARMADETSDAYKKSLKETDNEKGIDEDLKQKYAESQGIDYEKVEVDGTTITYTLADGSTRVIDEAAARAALAQEAAYDAITDDKIAEIEKGLNKINTKAAESFKNKKAGSAFANMVQGEVANFSKLSTAAFDEIKKASEDQDSFIKALGFNSEAELDQYAKDVGYKNGEAYIKAIKRGIVNYEIELKEITKNLYNPVKSAFKEESLATAMSEYGLTTKKVIAEGLQKAFEEGGQAGMNKLSDFLSSAQLSEKDVSGLMEALSGIDWSLDSATLELEKALDKQGIAIDTTNETWKIFISQMKESGNSAYTLANNLDNLTASLKILKEVASELKIGETLSKESYEALVAQDPNLKQYFVKDVSGDYLYLGGANNAIKIAGQKIINAEAMGEDVKNAIEGQGSLKQSNLFTYDEESGKYGLATGVTGTQIADFLRSEENSVISGKIFSSMGVSKDYFNEQVAKIDGTAVSSEVGYEGIKQQQLRNMTPAALALAKWIFINNRQGKDITTFSELVNHLFENYDNKKKDSQINLPEVESYAKDLGISKGEYEAILNTSSTEWTEAHRVVEGAKSAYTGANNYFSDFRNDIANFVNTDYNELEKSAKASINIATYDSYDEYYNSDAYKNDDEAVKSQTSKALLNRDALALEIDENIWEAYLNQEKDFTKASEMLSNIRTSQIYNEIDAYKKLNKELSNLEKDLKDLEDQSNKTFGAKSLDNIDAQISKIGELQTKENEIFGKKKNEWSTSAEALLVNNPILKDLLGKELTISTDKMSVNGIDTIRQMLLTGLDKNNNKLTADEIDILTNIVNSVGAHNDKITEGILENAEKNAEYINLILDKQIEAFNKKTELRIDLEQLEKDWLQFKQEYLDKANLGLNMFIEPDSIKTTENLLKNIALSENSLIGNLTDLQGFSNGTNKAEFTDIEGNFDEARYNEAYTEAVERVKESYVELFDYVNALYDTYFTAQDELMNIYDKQITKLSNINSLLSSQAELGKLIGKNATELNKFYENRRANAQESYSIAQGQLAAAQNAYNEALTTGNKDMIAKTEENLFAATTAVTNAATEMFNAIAEEFGNQLTGTIETFVKTATNLDLAEISEAWEREKEQEEKYLDDINASYAVDEIERKFQKSIDATDSITAQKKLNSVLQEQLKILKEKDKLSQYDIDRANAMYELTLKQIALEEAQQTATKMKLTRDVSGNYSYQYVQDADAVAAAEEELARAKNDLYNLDKDRNKSLVDEYYTIMTKANEEISAALAAGDEERAKRLQTYYFAPGGLLEEIQSELGIAAQNLSDIGQSIKGDEWASSIKPFTDQIASMDLGILAGDITKIMSDFVGKEGLFTNVKNSVSDLLSENGILDTVVSSVEKTVEGIKTLDVDAQKIATNANKIVTSIVDLTSALDEHAKSLTLELNSHLQVQANALLQENNTVLTNLNQTALRLLDKLDDGEINGTLKGYGYDDKTGLYSINAGDDT